MDIRAEISLGKTPVTAMHRLHSKFVFSLDRSNKGGDYLPQWRNNTHETILLFYTNYHELITYLE